MTPALDALQIFEKGASGTFHAPDGMPTQLYKFNREDMRAIRTALTHHTELEKAADGLAGALEKAMSKVEGCCDCLRCTDEEIIAKEALSTYRKAVG